MKTPESTYLSIGERLPGAANSQLFGKPCFKINGKAFICFFKDCMVFKLEGASHANALKLEGSLLFDPSGKGRPMKEWVQVPFKHASKWAGLAKKAQAYVEENS